MLSANRALPAALAFCLGWLLCAGVILALPARTADARRNAEGGSTTSRAVVINEVAWGGTAASSADEWIELYNTTGATVELSGWTLVSADNSLGITLAGSITRYGYYLIERTDDSTVSDVPADLATSFGAGLHNDGETLTLRDAVNEIVDTANGDGGDWPAGNGSPGYSSMERLNPFAPDSDDNWEGNDGVIRNGVDAGGNPINGTPKAWNSRGVAADVSIRKTGPLVAPPGGEITFTLSLSNSGELTATSVLVTDTLPPEVSYLGSSCPFSLTRPTSRTLVWKVGVLPPGAGPVTISFAGRLTDAVAGPITNTVRIATDAMERDLDDNSAEWSSLVGDPAQFADLVVGKSGPVSVTAGRLITYAISVRNSGRMTATAVILTDSLPAVVGFVSQSSDYAFTRPASGELVWELGALPPGASVAWTFAGLVADGAAGQVANVIVVASDTPEANFFDNRASVTTEVHYTPTVRLAAVHFHALQGADEAVEIANLGNAPAEIGGWGLADQDMIAVSLPPSVTLAAGQSVWLADEAGAFRAQFGFSPDFEAGANDPTVPDLDGSWPVLANDGDEVLLLNQDGAVQDVLVYKDGDASQNGWSGTAVQPFGAGALRTTGQILYRKLDQASGRPVADTDTAADWAQDTVDPVNGCKVRYPGWDLERFFHTVRLTQTASLTVAIGPDSLYRVVADEIDAAKYSLWIHSYTFENTMLAQTVAARAAAGVSVTVLLDGSPPGSVTDQERWVCSEIEAASGRCFFVIGDAENDVYRRYAHQHAKYIVIDGQRALIGSENLSLKSMPFDDKRNGTAGQRGVYLITDAPGVVAHLETLFALDMDLANHQDIVTFASIDPLPPGYTPISVTDWMTYTARFSVPLVLDGEFSFEIIQSPENSLRDSNALLGLLARAGEGDRVLVQQMHEPPYWGDRYSDRVSNPNPRLEAYLAAAQRGANVRVLLDSFYDDPTDPRGNWATCVFLRGIAAQERLRLGCRLGNPTEMGIHTKMVLVEVDGRRYVHLGSINGSELSSKANRELAVQVESSAAFAYLAEMFERDWPHLIYLPAVQNDWLGPADHVLISEVLYDPSGLDVDHEWVELYNPTATAIDMTGWMLGDAVDTDDFEAMFTFPAGAIIEPHQTAIVAVSSAGFLSANGHYPDYELLNLTPDVPDLIRHPTWGTGSFALGNGGDELLLFDSAGRSVDVLTWGSGSFPGVLPHAGVSAGGRSLERYPAWRDTDDCSHDFREWGFPNPGTVPRTVSLQAEERSQVRPCRVQISISPVINAGAIPCRCRGSVWR